MNVNDEQEKELELLLQFKIEFWMLDALQAK